LDNGSALVSSSTMGPTSTSAAASGDSNTESPTEVSDVSSCITDTASSTRPGNKRPRVADPNVNAKAQMSSINWDDTSKNQNSMLKVFPYISGKGKHNVPPRIITKAKSQMEQGKYSTARTAITEWRKLTSNQQKQANEAAEKSSRQLGRGRKRNKAAAEKITAARIEDENTRRIDDEARRHQEQEEQQQRQQLRTITPSPPHRQL